MHRCVCVFKTSPVCLRKRKQKIEDGKIWVWGLSKSITKWRDFNQTDVFFFRYLFIQFIIELHTHTNRSCSLIYLFTINLAHTLAVWHSDDSVTLNTPAVISFKNYADRCWQQLYLYHIPARHSKHIWHLKGTDIKLGLILHMSQTNTSQT